MSLSGRTKAILLTFFGLIFAWTASASAQTTGSLVYSNEIDGALIGEAAALLPEGEAQLTPAQVIEKWDEFVRIQRRRYVSCVLIQGIGFAGRCPRKKVHRVQSSR